MMPRSDGSSEGESFRVRSSSSDWNGTTGLGEESVDRGLCNGWYFSRKKEMCGTNELL